jgi:hypothetical protein
MLPRPALPARPAAAVPPPARAAPAPRRAAPRAQAAQPSAQPATRDRLAELRREREQARAQLAAAEAALAAELAAAAAGGDGAAPHTSTGELDGVSSTDINFGYIRQFSGEPFDQARPGGIPGGLLEMGGENLVREGRELLAAAGARVPPLLRGPVGVPPPAPSPEVSARQAALAALTLDAGAVWERERRRPQVAAPWAIKAPYYALCWTLDVLFEGRPLQRFWLLETVARMPYLSYISMVSRPDACRHLALCPKRGLAWGALCHSAALAPGAPQAPVGCPPPVVVVLLQAARRPSPRPLTRAPRRPPRSCTSTRPWAGGAAPTRPASSTSPRSSTRRTTC